LIKEEYKRSLLKRIKRREGIPPPRTGEGS
jgi:hypothetical protein